MRHASPQAWVSPQEARQEGLRLSCANRTQDAICPGTYPADHESETGSFVKEKDAPQLPATKALVHVR